MSKREEAIETDAVDFSKLDFVTESNSVSVDFSKICETYDVYEFVLLRVVKAS